ncbi:hypothetical protein ACNITK_26855, partial [Escherichia coli]
QDCLATLRQPISNARAVQLNLPGAQYRPNTQHNQFRRDAADMLDAARRARYQRGRRPPGAEPAPVDPRAPRRGRARGERRR